MHRYLSVLSGLVLLFVCLNANAWNALGHMVIANIAYQNLKPEVRAKVDRLVEYFHEEYPNMDSLLQLAYWPDAIRSQKIETFTRWHYINVSFSKDNRKVKDTYDTDNAVWALKNIHNVVKYEKANVYERARFLAFFVHIVGDLHQPLHTVDLVSEEHPDGDEGGNLYHVKYKNKRVKLHALWDRGVDVFDLEPSVNNANILSNQITALYSKAYFGKRIEDLKSENWLKEGMYNAKTYVYSTPEDKPVSEKYIEDVRVVAKQQAALAGYRLGALLNHLLA